MAISNDGEPAKIDESCLQKVFIVCVRISPERLRADSSPFTQRHLRVSVDVTQNLAQHSHARNVQRSVHRRIRSLEMADTTGRSGDVILGNGFDMTSSKCNPPNIDTFIDIRWDADLRRWTCLGAFGRAREDA